MKFRLHDSSFLPPKSPKRGRFSPHQSKLKARMNAMRTRQQTNIVTCLLAASTAAIMLVLLFHSSLPAAAQNAAQATGPTLKVTTEVVNVYAVVRTKHGRLVPDLTKNDFQIKEDNVTQKITYFSRETDTPLTLAIMVDTSPSQERVLYTEQREAKAFLRQILRAKDLACVIHFDLEVELLQDFTIEQNRLDKAIWQPLS
jgi:hypothetical protein